MEFIHESYGPAIGHMTQNILQPVQEMEKLCAGRKMMSIQIHR